MISSPMPTVDPQDPWKPHAATIVSITQEVPRITTYELRIDDPEVRNQYRFRPGQFNMLYLPGFGEAAISISSDPHQPERLLHTVRAVGNVTIALARKQVGDQLLFRGPFGSSWPIAECEGGDLVIACGGLGLPPLRPVIYDVIRRRESFGRVTLLYGARTPGDLLFPGEYDNWRKAGIQVEVTVDLGDASWQGHVGVVPTLFERLRLAVERTRVLTCGPEIMMRFVIDEALSQGCSPQRVFLSMERNMNCAVGLCGHCQLGPAFICKDGPVFRYDHMEPYLRLEDY